VRLERLAGRRLTRDGIIVIRSDRFRTQERNRADARQRLHELIMRASVVPKARIATKPTRAAVKRRLEAKQRRGKLKHARRERPALD
jgi:ribosome-associated protein